MYETNGVDANCLPGVLLKVHHFWQPGDFTDETLLLDERGALAIALGIPALGLTQREPSGLTVDNATKAFQAGADVSLPQYGITAGGTLNTGVVITLEIPEIEKIALDAQTAVAFYQRILPSAKAAMKKPPNQFLQDCAVVTEAFFVKSFSATVHTTGSVTGEAALNQVGFTASANVHWDNDHQFTWNGGTDVPFAVRAQGLGSSI